MSSKKNEPKPLIERDKDEEGFIYVFWCPGCKMGHWFRRPRWHFNGDVYCPTVRPSIVTPDTDGGTLCHLFITQGKLQFLDDCKHDLKGKTVNLEPIWG